MPQTRGDVVCNGESRMMDSASGKLEADNLAVELDRVDLFDLFDLLDLFDLTVLTELSDSAPSDS
jgi:hypothetical protein